jgi:DNA-binding NarL/FixJ family response regulator
MIRALVVSPVPALRAGLRSLLSEAGDIAVIAESARLEALDELLAEHAPEVVVVDPGFQLGESLDDAPAANSIEPRPAFVVVGDLSRPSELLRRLEGSAWGYLPREASGEQIAAAVRAVAAGLVVVARAQAEAVLGTDGAAGRSGSGDDQELSVREREVLQLVALGLPNKTIANRLAISEHTVKFHVAAILAKLGASSRTEAVHLGAQRGLVAL